MPNTDVATRVLSIVTSALHVHWLDRKASFGLSLDELGLDSLERVELALELERAFNVEVQDELVAPGQTIAGLIRACEELCDERRGEVQLAFS